MFIVGDSISVLDDDINGTVIAVIGDNVTVETADGFHMIFNANELVKVNTEVFHFKGIEQAKTMKESSKKTYNQSGTKKKHQIDMVIDLHIEKLVKSKKGMSNYDILSLQLDTAKHRLEFAITKRYQRIVFIHGVGDGVLKADLYSMFNRYDRIQFYDASYVDFGLGATEIRILQGA